MTTIAMDLSAAGWMAVGAAMALVAMVLRQKFRERREARRRGGWDAY